jgi:hypothetical protein
MAKTARILASAGGRRAGAKVMSNPSRQLAVFDAALAIEVAFRLLLLELLIDFARHKPRRFTWQQANAISSA